MLDIYNVHEASPFDGRFTSLLARRLLRGIDPTASCVAHGIAYQPSTVLANVYGQPARSCYVIAVQQMETVRGMTSKALICVLYLYSCRGYVDW